MSLKLNIGASRIWSDDSWHILDHKMEENEEKKIVSGTATNIRMSDNSCDVVFASHVFEHIPHIELPLVLAEINRVLKPNGVLRFLTPNLKAVATAYANKDYGFFQKAKEEDPSIRTDLGLGGMLANFMVSPGQDTVLLDRSLTRFIGGYAHLYNYDFEMFEIMLSEIGFKDINDAHFCVSSIDEMSTPLHVKGYKPIWQPLNPDFFGKNNLIHEMRDGVYHCNFLLQGFDRDPVTSLIVEAKKSHTVNLENVVNKFNKTKENYNRYSNSLLFDEEFCATLRSKNISFEKPETI